jgi:hypothetical protein
MRAVEFPLDTGWHDELYLGGWSENRVIESPNGLALHLDLRRCMRFERNCPQGPRQCPASYYLRQDISEWFTEHGIVADDLDLRWDGVVWFLKIPDHLALQFKLTWG